MTQIAFPYNSTVGAKARMDRSRFTDTYATGKLSFSGQPTANDTVGIAGATVTFVATGAAGNQVNIGADLAATLTALAAFLNASADANLKKCSYAADATSLTVTAKASGVDGNALTLDFASTVVTRSGATLTGGATLRAKWALRTAGNRYEPADNSRWATRESASRWSYTPGSYYPS